MPEVRAWIVSTYDNEYSDVVFAETRGQAKAWADLPECPFLDRRVHRAPALDQYRDKPGGPTREDLRKHGWVYECDGCDTVVFPDEGGVIDGQIYCDECLLAQQKQESGGGDLHA